MSPTRRRGLGVEGLERRELLAGDVGAIVVELNQPVDFEGALEEGAAEVAVSLEDDGRLDLHVTTAGGGIATATLRSADGEVVGRSIDLGVPLPEVIWPQLDLPAGEYTLSLVVTPYGGEPISPEFFLTAHVGVIQDPVEPVDEPDDFASAAPLAGDAAGSVVAAGRLDGADDVDVFKFQYSAAAGAVLEVFGLPMGPEATYGVEVYSADQSLIAGGVSSEAEPLRLSLPELDSGEYFLRLSGDAASPYFIDVHSYVPTDPGPIVDDYPDVVSAGGPGVDLTEGHAPLDVFVEGATGDVDVVRIAAPAGALVQGHLMATGAGVHVELIDAAGDAVGTLTRLGGPGLQLIELEAAATGDDLYLRVSTTGGDAELHADLVLVGSAAASTPERLAAATAFDAAFAALEEEIVREEVPPLDGDVNRDGQVDLADFALLKAAFGETGDDLAADFDRDGVVGLRDFALLKSAMG